MSSIKLKKKTVLFTFVSLLIIAERLHFTGVFSPPQAHPRFRSCIHNMRVTASSSITIIFSNTLFCSIKEGDWHAFLIDLISDLAKILWLSPISHKNGPPTSYLYNIESFRVRWSPVLYFDVPLPQCWAVVLGKDLKPKIIKKRGNTSHVSQGLCRTMNRSYS